MLQAISGGAGGLAARQAAVAAGSLACVATRALLQRRAMSAAAEETISIEVRGAAATWAGVGWRALGRAEVRRPGTRCQLLPALPCLLVLIHPRAARCLVWSLGGWPWRWGGLSAPPGRQKWVGLLPAAQGQHPPPHPGDARVLEPVVAPLPLAPSCLTIGGLPSCCWGALGLGGHGLSSDLS